MPTPLPHALCAHLRCKKLFMISDDREIAQEDLQTAGHEDYWCSHTCTDTGPDGGWVMFSYCEPGRACYRPLERSNSLTSRYLEERAAFEAEAAAEPEAAPSNP